MDFSQLYYYKPVTTRCERIIEADVVIYGGTPAGIACAVQLKRNGVSVVIAEFSKHLGGITASGLGATDLGAEAAVGGIAKEFYDAIGTHYGKTKQFQFEPKVASQIFKGWIERYEIPCYYEQHLEKVEKENTKITNIHMEDGTIYKGSMFIDCTYEGDLLARAGVSYFVGRESNSMYKEIYNGIQFGAPHHKFEKWIDPYVIEGNPSSGLLFGISNEPISELGFQGQGDQRIQAYNFRICLTKNKDNKVPIPKPNNYDATRYLLLLRYIQQGIWDVMKLHTPLPNDKTDLNNYGAFSTDNIGRNYNWPEGNYLVREDIFQDHVTYDIGLLYFLGNDELVPENIRNEVSQWGLPKDEFVLTNHWPHQLYIREARRMISDYVMTDKNCLQFEEVQDSVGLASFHMDSHNVRRVVIDGRVVNEGDVQVPIPPFAISYQSIRPKKTQCSNLLVPVCLSSSHIAYGSIRMEPVFMILGQSAGIAATIAIQRDLAVQDITYNNLKEELISAGQILAWDDTIQDSPTERMKETFGK
ncbi:FAD-dependent oxidoreductase [Solibacillus sp. CAU 1738]|uniref:FAD-dependent oxidoreductase n=1 Tax=Solibacillus sp. CAU 1738 TaxID=3140363 RepID=UPI003260183E